MNRRSITSPTTAEITTEAPSSPQNGSAQEEATLAFRNVFAALHHAGFAPGDIAFVQIDFADLADVAAVNAVFATLFDAGRRPARTIVQAAGLPYGAKVKIVVTAAKER